MRTRRIYQPIRIDFTPLASIALLLVFFFVFLESEKRDSIMSARLPDVPDNGHYTRELSREDVYLFLLADNLVGVLHYVEYSQNAEFVEVDYSPEHLRKYLTAFALHHEHGPIVSIIPTDQSTFKNLVDVFDELNIVGHVGFRIADMTDRQKRMLTKYEAYKSNNPAQPVSMHLHL